MLKNLQFFLGIIIIIANCQHVLTQCVDDLSKFQSDSDSPLAKHFVRMNCRESDSGRGLTNFGIIISKDAVLTSHQVNRGEYWTCYVKYGNIEAPVSTSGKLPNIIKSRSIQTYKSRSIRSPSFTPLAYIFLEEEIKLDSTSASPIRWTRYPYRNHDKCVVVGGDKLHHSSKIVEREVEVLDQGDCKLQYPKLDEDNMCIRIPKEFCKFNHCEYYSRSAGLVCNGMFFALVGDHTSQTCNSSYPRTCAGLSGAYGWIKALEKTVSFNADYKRATVKIGLQKPNEKFYGLGAIISRYRVLTAYVPFKYDTSEEGYVDYGNRRGLWRYAEPVTFPSLSHRGNLQLYVIALEEGIRLFPGGPQAVKLANELPHPSDECVVGTFKPRWMLFAVTIFDHAECRKHIRYLHKDHLCIRQKFPSTFDELEGGETSTNSSYDEKKTEKFSPLPITQIILDKRCAIEEENTTD
uniref:Peptidase S1 domain-containing protein n=1 Tax=Glossina palpalis gambiensis TaxID=67801 RepID=A0A1B0AVG7_9MUSC